MNISVLIPIGDIRDLFITPAVIQAFENLGSLRLNHCTEYDPHVIKQLLADCHVCVTGWGCPMLDESLLSDAHNLRMIAHTGGSVASIASDYVYDRGIHVISGNKLYAVSVAEGTLAYILAALRQIPFYSSQVEKGNWGKLSSYSAGLFGKKVGLLGFGAIARYLVPMLRLFTTEIQIYDPFVDESICRDYCVTRTDSLKALFTECDIISNHLPLTNDTRHIVSADLLNLMRQGALFVNTARGKTVDEKALENILNSGKIYGVLDVFESEPLPMESKLRGLDNVILMPHMAGLTYDRRESVGLALAEDIKHMLDNKPLSCEISRDYAAMMTNDRLV